MSIASKNTAIEPLLTDVEAAAILNVKPATLEFWRCRNKGPSFIKAAGRLGAVRYRRTDLIEWIERHVVDPKAARK